MNIESLKMPDGFELVYRIAGPAGAPPLLICHGLSANHVQFEADVHHFARKWRVIQPDLRGHGDSGAPPQATTAQFTCRKFAEDLAFLLDHLGTSRIDVIGNSLGGNIALELIALRPGLVRSLVTFGTTYQLDVPKWVLLVRDVLYWLLGKRLAKWAAEKTSQTPQGRAALTRTFSLMRPQTAKLVGPNICKFDYRGVVEGFEGWILLLQCRGDDAINRALGPTLETLARHRRARVVQFATGGHCANVDDPVGFRAQVEAFHARIAEEDARSAALQS